MNAKLLHCLKTPIISWILFAGIFAFAQSTFAQAPVPADPAAPAVNTAGNDALNFLDDVAGKSGLGNVKSGETATLNIIGNIINVVLGFVGVIFFILMFWAGVRWMTSAGNEEIVKEAKNTIKTSVIGIAVVFLAFLFTNFVLNQIKTIREPGGSLGTCFYASSPSECSNPGRVPEMWTGELKNITKELCEQTVYSGDGQPCTDEYLWTPNE